MSDFPITLAELELPIPEFKNVVEAKVDFELSANRLRQLVQPVIHRTAFKKYTFDDHWKTRRWRFTAEDSHKVDILYNTECRELILNHIKSKYGFTLAEELKGNVPLNETEKTGKGKWRKSIVNKAYYEKNKAKVRLRQINAQKGSSQSDNSLSIEENNREVANMCSDQSPQAEPSNEARTFPTSTPAISDTHHSESVADGTVTRGPDDGWVDEDYDDHGSHYDCGDIPRSGDLDHGSRTSEPLNEPLNEPSNGSSISLPDNSIELDPTTQDSTQVSAKRTRASRPDLSNAAFYDFDEDNNRIPPDETFNSHPNRAYQPLPTFTGHVYDSFGVITKQKSSQPCCSSTSRKTSKAEIYNSAQVLDSLEDLIEKIIENQIKGAKDSDYLSQNQLADRQRIVQETPMDSHLYHINLEYQMHEWDTMEKLVEKCHEFVSIVKSGTGYPFVRNKNIVELSSGFLGMVYKCGNFSSYIQERKNKGKRTEYSHSPLDCRGTLEMRLYPDEQLMAVKIDHAEHSEMSRDRVHKGLPPHVLEEVINFFDMKYDLSMPKSDFIRRFVERFEDEAPRYRLSSIYDRMSRARYTMDASDFLSAMKFYQSLPEDYATFVFYSGPQIGIAVVRKKIISQLSDKLESLAVNSTHDITKHKCEMVVANATIGRTDVPIGHMFISDIETVVREVSSAKPGVEVRELKPLDQCELAESIDGISNKLFAYQWRTALLTSFLILMKGTDKKIYAQLDSVASGCSHDFHDLPGTNTPDLQLCKMATELTEESPLAYKKFLGICKIPVLTCDKDMAEINALNFAFPGVPVKLCFWRFGESARRALCSNNRRFILRDWISSRVFPTALKDIFPSLFDNKAHSPKCCPFANPQSALYSVYKCWRCNPEYYDNWADNKISDNIIIPAGVVNCDDIIGMQQRHSRAFNGIPQTFPFLRELVNLGQDAACYDPETMHKYIIYEMLEFCLQNRILGAFQYLWDQWYEEEWFDIWTQCHSEIYKPFPMNRTADGQFSRVKAKMGVETASIRLDHLIFIDHNDLYPEHLSALKYI